MMPGDSDLSSILPACFDHQDQQFAAAFSILRKAIANRAFPAASVAVVHAGKLVALKAFGHFTYDPDDSATEEISGAPWLADFARRGNSPVQPTTLFDLASLTKVIATTPMAMILYERGLLDLDMPVAAVIPEFLRDAVRDSRRRNVTLRMLLAHSSGLPAYEKLFQKAQTRDELLHAAFTTPLTAHPGTRALYSDIGFIILGVALERLADESLDRFSRREVFAPLAMTNTTFNPPSGLRNRIAPTQDDLTFRHRIIQGEVQDENAYVLGGVAAHASLFSSASDLSQFAQCMLNGGKHVFRPETIALFTSRQSTPAESSRALGWDTPSNPSQSGKFFSQRSFGHLGYTGTSLWIDPARQLSITLLTNRTWPDCASQAIKQIRPAFQNAIVEAL